MKQKRELHCNIIFYARAHSSGAMVVSLFSGQSCAVFCLLHLTNNVALHGVDGAVVRIIKQAYPFEPAYQGASRVRMRYHWQKAQSEFLPNSLLTGACAFCSAWDLRHQQSISVQPLRDCKATMALQVTS